MKNRLLLLMTFLLAASCNTNSRSGKLEKLQWLIGDWQMKSKEGNFIESWQQVNDTMLSGQGFFITVEGDTVFREQLKVVNLNDTLHYVVITAQNGAEPVSFGEVSLTKDEIIFENTAHDFPQRIIYQKKSEKQLIAIITGKQNGEERTEDFNMVKR